MASANKRKKPAKKSSARTRSSSKAKPRAQRSAGNRTTPKSDESSNDLLAYSDIRRSLHGAILRNLR
jgi:hypothetical protein